MKARNDSQRSTRGLDPKAPRAPEPPTKEKPAKTEKDGADLLKKDPKKTGEEPKTPREKP